MSNAIIPLTGLAYEIRKRPLFATLIQETVAGDPTRISLRPYPRWELEANFKFLRDDSYNELNPLLDFFLARRGAWDSFLLEDPKDNALDGQVIGVGDADQTVWQLVRSFIPGGFLEPVKNLKIPPTPKVYLNDVEQESGWSIDEDTGILTFVTPPGEGVEITMDCSFYWRVCFKEDLAEFEYFSFKLWHLNQITMVSVSQ